MKKILLLILLLGIMLVAGCTSETNGNGDGGDGTDIGVGGNALQDFANVVSKGARATYKVDYTYTASGDSGSQTWYAKGIKKKIVAEVQGMIASVYYLPEGVFTCTNVQGQDMCFKSSATQDSTAIVGDIYNNPEGYNVVSKSGRIIAGQSTSCFGLTKAGSGELEVCYADSGVTMYLQGSGTTMQATSYSTSVSDSEFELPATPQTIPAGY